MSNGELILYTTEDGKTAIHLKAQGETVWLTQMEIADLFQTTKQNISLRIKNIFLTNELSEEVVKDNLTTATDGKRYKTKLYNHGKPRKVEKQIADDEDRAVLKELQAISQSAEALEKNT